MHVIANVILPTVYEGVTLGGMGSSVILIDTDHLFTLLRLVSVLEHRIMSKLELSSECGQLIHRTGSGEVVNGRIESVHLTEQQIESCVKCCLARLATDSYMFKTLYNYCQISQIIILNNTIYFINRKLYIFY